MLDNGLAYLRISSFTTETGASLDKVFAQLQKDSKGEIKGMILDLRNNPGGVLDAAVKVGDAFLTQGPIVTIKGRNPGEQRAFDATAGDIRSEEHTSELQSLMRISYAGFCLEKKTI